MAKPHTKSKETSAELKARTRKISAILRKTYAGMGCALHFRNPFELLIATILSAQSTDVGVNKATPALFKKFPTPAALAAGDLDAVKDIIRTTGFFNTKAKSIQATSRALVENFGGKVPREMDELTTLPGVGRKTAHVVRGNAFDLPAIFVDTHFKRLAGRLALTPQTDPVKIEYAIADLLPENEWTEFSHAMIWHGRKICHARGPLCAQCPVLKLCPAGQAIMAEQAGKRVASKKPRAGK